MRGLIVSFVVVVTLVLVGGIAACASMKDKHAEALRDTRVNLNRAPGQPRPAIEYASAITYNLYERDANDRVVVTDDEVKFAIDNLEQAAERVPEEAPVIWRREGDLYMALRDADKAEAAYRRSLKAKPDKEPLWALIRIAGGKKNAEQVRALCVEGASAIVDHELNQHIEQCASAGGLSSKKTALEWLKDEDRKRYDDYYAKKQAKEAAEEADKAEKNKKYAVCAASCEEKRAACNSRCRAPKPNEPDKCAESCTEVESACKNTCAVSVK
jgi:tetratricopeptide (TPR) repeat protein